MTERPGETHDSRTHRLHVDFVPAVFVGAVGAMATAPVARGQGAVPRDVVGPATTADPA